MKTKTPWKTSVDPDLRDGSDNSKDRLILELRPAYGSLFLIRSSLSYKSSFSYRSSFSLGSSFLYRSSFSFLTLPFQGQRFRMKE